QFVGRIRTGDFEFEQHSKLVFQTFVIPMVESEAHELWYAFQKVFRITKFDGVEELQHSKASGAVRQPEPSQGFEVCVRLQSVCSRCLHEPTIKRQRESTTLGLKKQGTVERNIG